jgi:hypothetical protein
MPVSVTGHGEIGKENEKCIKAMTQMLFSVRKRYATIFFWNNAHAVK